MEELESRVSPSVQDFWQPLTAIGSDKQWSTPTNWSLGHSPRAANNPAEVATFDNTHVVGQGAQQRSGDADCTITSNVEPYGLEFIHTWSKTLNFTVWTITCDGYLNVQSDANLNFGTAVGSTGNIMVEGINDDTSTIDGAAHFDGVGATAQSVTFEDQHNFGSVVNIGSNGYTDVSFYFGTASYPAVHTQLDATGGTWTVGKNHNVTFGNAGWMTLNADVNHNTVPCIQHPDTSGGGTANNTYVTNYWESDDWKLSDGPPQTDWGEIGEIDTEVTVWRN